MANSISTPPTLTKKDIERFWSLVDRSNPDGCWPWTGYRHPKGYGYFNIQRKGYRRNLLVHRVALFLIKGIWAPVAMHHCDNRPCCRVGSKHVGPGTTAKNNRDMADKGRVAHGLKHGSYTRPDRRPMGERIGTSKLSASEVRAIRAEYATGTFQWIIANKYGITQTAVSHIIRRASWKHID